MMKPVKVLHVVGDSRFGGAGWIILRLCQIAKDEGWQVDVLTTDPPFQQAVLRQGLGVVNLDVIRRAIRPLWDLWGLIRLYRFFRRQRYSIVHTHTSKAGFVGRLAGYLAGVPIIVHTAHGFAFHELSPLSTRFLYATLERLASRWSNRIVSVSEFHRRWALELGMCKPHQIVAIPNGVATAERNSEIASEDLRCMLGVHKGDLLILSVSRLAADKGLEYLIEAAATLPRIRHGIRIAIAGDGPIRSRLEQLAFKKGVADRVLFLGFRRDIGDLLAACDLVVLPSLREGFSIALLEAMAAGKPIIATAIGSQRELVSQADMACLVPPADAKTLCEAILRLIGDPHLMSQLGMTARALFERCYTEDRMLSAYRQLYLELLQSTTHRRHVQLASRGTPATPEYKTVTDLLGSQPSQASDE
jgi:glycosyltransferase involved in cell wall biosynthesis